MVISAPTALLRAANLRHNIAVVRARCAGSVRFCAVVKADAYGHDSRLVVSCLAEDGADSFAVYTIEEAEHIYGVARNKPILIMQPIFAGTEAGQVKLAAGRHFHCTVCSAAGIRRIETALATTGQRLNVHLKIDTGMGRSGCRVGEVGSLLEAIAASGAIRLTGIYTHLATADEADLTFAREQLAAFDSLLRTHKLTGRRDLVRHACNSAGALRVSAGHYDMVRVGIAMYG